MKDEHLNKMLQGWKQEADLPASFQRDVWHRIEAAGARKSPVAAWLADLMDWLAKPLPATVTCVLTLGLGLLAGGMVGGSHADAQTAAYAYSIDPLARRPAP